MNESKQLSAVASIAKRLSISESELTDIVKKTVFPSGKPVTNEQFMAFMAVANEYGLNPITKQIYAYPAQGGGIQPIVSIDGWLKIINTHPNFNGMEFEDIREDGNLVAIKCSIWRKGIEKPIQVTEYMNECKGSSQPWTKYPSRMLRHKAAIQGGRYAFGLSGIIDSDEAERFQDSGVIDMGSADVVEKNVEFYSDSDFEKNFSGFKAAILKGKSVDDMIGMIETKAPLTDAQKEKLQEIKPEDKQQ